MVPLINVQRVFVLCFILINLVGFLLVKDRYIYFLPKTGAPNHITNAEEIKQVQDAVRRRTPADERFHRLTDASVSPAFERLLKQYRVHTTLDRYILQHVSTILAEKLRHNRARPWQVDPDLRTLKSVSANSPSYPSGHAYQAWVLYRILSFRYPQLQQQLYALAEYCTRIRVIAGLHYPSDGEYSKALVMRLSMNSLISKI